MKDRGMLIGYDGDFIVNPGRNAKNEIVTGIITGNTLYQNQYIILKAHKGELKEFPVLGAGLSDITNDNDTAGWGNEIKRQLEKDGMKVSKVRFDENMNFKIDAEYENK